MPFDHSYSQNPSSLAAHDPTKSSSLSRSESPSINLSADSPQQSADKIRQLAKALKACAGKSKLAQELLHLTQQENLHQKLNLLLKPSFLIIRHNALTSSACCVHNLPYFLISWKLSSFPKIFIFNHHRLVFNFKMSQRIMCLAKAK